MIYLRFARKGKFVRTKMDKRGRTKRKKTTRGVPSNQAGQKRPPDWVLWRFDYEPCTRLIFGVNSVERVGELAPELAQKKSCW